MISAVVLTKNEERNIKDCLEALKWCDEIVVVDDYSEDKTVEIAKKLGAKIFRRYLNDNFAAQRNFGLKKARGDWVLFVDADERVTDKLADEIQNTPGVCRRRNTTPGVEGFYLKRRDWFGGRWLKYGETANVRLLRLARKNAGKWQRRVHEVWKINGQTGELKNPLLHYPHPTISEFLENINFFSSLHAKVLFKEGVKVNLFQIIAYPLGKFLQNYFWRLGFLDGMSGLTVTLMMSFHSFLARGKLYRLWKN